MIRMARKMSCTLAVAGALAALPEPARAFELITDSGNCPNGFVYPGDQQLGINLINTPSADVFAFTAAVIQVGERINNVGGQDFDYTFTTLSGGYAGGQA